MGVAFADFHRYWEGRDVQALVKEVGEWNAMIAGLVGGMKDLLGTKDVKSEITKFPNFEHLEAEGRAGEAVKRRATNGRSPADQPILSGRTHWT